MAQPIPPSGIDWNNFFNLASIIALVALSIVIVAMVFFTVKYREKKGQARFIPVSGLSKSRARDAVIFASISIIILLSLTLAQDRICPNLRFEPPASQSLAISVTAYQWDFRFEYPNGVNSTKQLYLPANTTVMFNVTSTDVMHNFFLVQYKVSIDAIPGRYNIIWITTPPVNGNETLSYSIVCKELCGAGHSFMGASMTVMSSSAFNQWLSNQTTTNSTGTGG
jgi:cytochrome c oxidase subunit II